MELKNVKIISGAKRADKRLRDFASVFLSSSLELNPDREYLIMSGFCDVHVHLREPDFSYKETIKTGTLAAARGGYTAVCTMPNLNPVPDTLSALNVQRAIIEKDAQISVYPYAAITKGERGEELSDMEDLAPYVVAFSDDGKGVQSEEMMRRAMVKAKSLGKIVAAHCEVDELLKGGYIHDGEYAKAHGHKGICSESEYREIERDLKLAKETGAAFHVCHVSAAESVGLIRKAKAEGVDVTCETAPHYLVLDETDLKESGDYKMNPPLRGKKDREALIEGLKDGTIDMIATDHAPHSKEEKSKGLKGSAFGVVGLETAFQVLYTELVKNGVITLDKLVDLMAVNPRERFNIPFDGFSVWDIDKSVVINPAEFLSKGKSTPFNGKRVFGENVLTVSGGRAVYKRQK
ncbi:MAG: dihydroorotase [Clostridia bacterium]|nr:dihydroorotase [Clostridia bacterium]